MGEGTGFGMPRAHLHLASSLPASRVPPVTEMPEQIQQIKAGYEFAGGALAFGAAVLDLSLIHI